MDSTTVAVVGPGAIGTTIAAALHEVGRTPTLYGRTSRSRLELRDDDGVVVEVPGPVRTEVHQIDEPVDLVFLAVKATQTAVAAPWLQALCHPTTVVCVLQNGVEQDETVAPLLARGRVLPSVVWFPAESRRDGSVWLRGRARLTLPDRPEALAVCAVLDGTRCVADVTSDYVSVAWRKLLQNAAAGLMVLARRRCGMFARADITELTLAYLRECIEVARAEGAVLEDGVAAEIVDVLHNYPPDLGTSILADRDAGRPLEWETRNGVIVRRGRDRGIATPISDVVVPLLAAASDGPG